MGMQPEREGVREAFRTLFLADREKGRARDLAHYKGLFPGFWDVVGEEFDAIAREGRPEGPAATSGPSAPPTRPGPGAVAPEAVPEIVVERIGPYRILKELGRGGMGVVYLAEDTRIGRRVALKVLAAHFSSSKPLLRRFQREAELAGKIDHPHICTVYEAGEADGRAYMAMRLVEGKPLSEWIGLSKDATRPSGVVTLPPLEELKPDGKAASGESKRDLDRILLLTEKAARALHVAHEKGLIHRDIKPHNIMVTAEGEPVLLDFGLARDEEGEGQQLTQTGSLMGTPAYMSPEQLTAARIRLDRRTDVYSLGATLYECLTLRLPFEAPTLDGLYQKILATDPVDPRRVNNAIPRDLDVVVATALEKNRDRRYQTAADLAEELRRVRDHEPIRAKPVGPLGRLARWSQRSPGVASSLAVILLLLVGGLAVISNLLVAARTSNESLKYALDAESKSSETARRERDARTAALEAETRARAEALAERDEKEVALTRARVLGLLGASVSAGRRDSMAGLLLARAAARIRITSETVTRLHEALTESRETVYFRGHLDAVYSVRFSPGGDRVVTASRDGTARVWSLEGRQLLEVAVAEEVRDWNRRFYDAWISPDGLHLLTARGTNDALTSITVLWDASGKRLAELRGPEKAGVGHVARFLPDGSGVVCAYRNGAIRFWTMDGTMTREVRAHGTRITAFEFSPSGTSFVTGAEDGSIGLWNLSGERLAELLGHEGQVSSIRFSGDGRALLTAAWDGTARLWDMAGSPTGTIRCGAKGLSSAEFLSGGRIVTLDFDGNAAIWSREGVVVAPVRPPEGPARCVAVSPAGDRILTTTIGNRPQVALWDVDGRELERFNIWATGATFDGTGERVLLNRMHGAPCLVTLGGKEVASLRMELAVGVPPVFVEARDSVLVVDRANVIHRIGAEGSVAARYDAGGSPVRAVASTPDLKHVVAASADGGVRVWTWDGRPVSSFATGWRSTEPESRSPFQLLDDRILILSELRDLTGRRVAILDIPGTGEFRHVSPGGRFFVRWSLSTESPAVAIDDGGRRVGDLECHGDARSVSASPTGRIVALPSGDEYGIRLATPEGRTIAVLLGHQGKVNWTSFSPSGARVLTASEDGTARLWTLEGRETLRIQGKGSVWEAFFSPAGDRIVVVDEGGIHLHSLEGKLLCHSVSHHSGSDGTGRGATVTWQFSEETGAFLEVTPEGIVLRDRDGNPTGTIPEQKDDSLWPTNLGFLGGGRRLAVVGGGRVAIYAMLPEDLLRLADERCSTDLEPWEREKYRDLLGEPAGAGK